MIPIIESDILTAEADIVVHQVNTLGKMGKGLAKQIAERYPELKEEYGQIIDAFNSKGRSLTGKVFLYATHDGTIIANIFAQETIQKKNQPVKMHTNVEALMEGLEKVLTFATSRKNSYKIAIPTYIGCGLGGGDWEEIKPKIDALFSEHEDIVSYYHYR